MDEKIKELIAIGASIASHCQPCLKYHIEQAIKLGIELEEINAAIAVGKNVEKGALKAMDNFAKEQMENLNLPGTKEKSKNLNNNCCDGDSCCCL